eukprot:149359-Alexandrium_andersonii.AAC.1
MKLTGLAVLALAKSFLPECTVEKLCSLDEAACAEAGLAFGGAVAPRSSWGRPPQAPIPPTFGQGELGVPPC